MPGGRRRHQPKPLFPLFPLPRSRIQYRGPRCDLNLIFYPAVPRVGRRPFDCTGTRCIPPGRHAYGLTDKAGAAWLTSTLGTNFAFEQG